MTRRRPSPPPDTVLVHINSAGAKPTVRLHDTGHVDPLAGLDCRHAAGDDHGHGSIAVSHPERIPIRPFDLHIIQLRLLLGAAAIFELVARAAEPRRGIESAGRAFTRQALAGGADRRRIARVPRAATLIDDGEV